MNVTLKLTTEFEDIPEEVSHMLKRVVTELSTLRGDAHDISKDAILHSELALENIHLARLHMAKIDARMADCQSILNGFLHYSENPQEMEGNLPETIPTEENEEG